MTKFLNQDKVYESTGTFLKEPCTPIEWVAKSIPIRDDNGVEIGQLAPVTDRHLVEPKIVAAFASWREENEFAYPSRFEVTEAGTRRWMEFGVVNNPSRILFLILNQALLPVGHLGVLRTESDEFMLEVDNVLRGVKGDTPGLMANAMRALEEWAELEFSLERIELRVLKSNGHAVDFYEKLGYTAVSEKACVWEEQGDSRVLVPGTGADDFLVTMSKALGSDAEIPELILTAGSSIGSHERSYAFSAAAYGWNSRHSDFLTGFEAAFASYVGAEFAMATSSCTGALHLALLAAGIGPGDEVIVPEITWVATASAIMYTGATPIFADVDESSWTIDPESVRALITARTKAILPVHLYGFSAPMPDIMNIARDHGLRVIEDAAPAIGATIDTKCVGTFGDFGCYSFQGAKMLVTGEGGMLVTDNPDLAARARKLQDHGRKPGTFWIEQLGYKYKMSNIQGALGLGQILRSDNQIHRKRRIRGWYEDALLSIDGLQMQQELPGTRSIDWMTSMTYDGWTSADREAFMTYLKQNGVDTRPVFPPLSQFPIWGYNIDPRPTAARIGSTGVNLPSGVRLSRSEVNKVSGLIWDYFSG